MSNRWLKYSFIIIGAISIIIPIVGSFFYSHLHIDSSILLSEVERVYEGYVPYIDMHLNYPPLWFYIMAGLKWIFNVSYGCYNFYLFVHYLFVIGNMLCIFYLSQRFSFSKIISIFCAWVFFVMSHWLHGNCVLFEMPSIFMGLLSCVLLMIKNENKYFVLLAGIFGCFSFLIKQFGAGFLALAILLIFFFKEKQKLQHIAIYVVGYFIPLLVCFLLFRENLVNSVLLNGYGTSVGPNVNNSFIEHLPYMMECFFYFCYRIFPLIIISICIPLFTHKSQQIKIFVFSMCGILGFMLQFFFISWGVQGALHYYIYCVPFAAIMTGLICDIVNKDTTSKNLSGGVKLAVLLIVIFSIIPSVYSTYYNRVYKLYYKNFQKKDGHIEFAKKVGSMIKEEDSTIFVTDASEGVVYYINNLLPPNMFEVGYSNGPNEMTEERAYLQATTADYILYVLPTNYPDPIYISPRIKKHLSKLPYDTISIGEFKHHLYKQLSHEVID